MTESKRGGSLRALREAILRLDVFVLGRYLNSVIGNQIAEVPKYDIGHQAGSL